MNRATGYCALVLALTLGLSSPALAEQKNFPTSSTQQEVEAFVDTLDLAATVQRALQENHSIEAALAGREAAEDARKSVRGSFGPVLATSYGYKKLQHKPGWQCA